MNKTSISRALLLAGVVAAAGVAQAQTFDVPQQAGEASTMTGGAPNELTTNSPYSDNGSIVVDTTVLGAPAATVVVPPASQSVVTTTTYVGPVVTWTQPMVPHHYQVYTLPAPVLNNADTVIIQNH